VITSVMNVAMVPLMAATLLIVVAGQIPAISDRLGQVAAVVPLYVAFLVVMAGLGWLLARLFRLDVPSSRALIFTGATRNSLVVLPLALALPDAYAISAVIVVTQTLVELVGMVIYVRAVPRLVPQHPQPTQ
jgi:ACR3 family arsenite transporter